MHAGHEREFFGFAGSKQSLVEDAKHRVVARRHQRRNVQRSAYARSTAPDDALAAHAAAVATEGTDAHQCADLLLVEQTQFRQLRPQAEGGDPADTWHRSEHIY